MPQNRRDWMLNSASTLAAMGVGVAAGGVVLAEETTTKMPRDGKSWRVGVISARIKGKPQRVNGHTWHFAQYLHPTINLATFCDKPIGESVAGTRKILEFARSHKAPLMSGSIFRFEWGVEEVRRLVAEGAWGEIQYVIASMQGGYSPEGWFIYGQHPLWTIVTLLGAGAEAISLYAQGSAAHGLVTYSDRPPGEVWYGRPDLSGKYNETSVHFAKDVYRYSPAIEGSFRLGHHYEMFNMARAFREMVRTGVEPVPHREILEVTAMIHAAARSLQEKSRLVALAEVLG